MYGVITNSPDTSQTQRVALDRVLFEKSFVTFIPTWAREEKHTPPKALVNMDHMT